MLLRFQKSLIIYCILILYVLMPMLDSIACANCMDKEALKCITTIGCLKAPCDEAGYTSHDETGSKTPGKQAATSFCSICANFLVGVEVFPSQVHLSVVQWVGLSAVPALSDLHHSIDKPPQNSLL